MENDYDEINDLADWYTEHAAGHPPATTTTATTTDTCVSPFHAPGPGQDTDDAHTSASLDNTFLSEDTRPPSFPPHVQVLPRLQPGAPREVYVPPTPPATQHQHEVWGVDRTGLTLPAAPTWGLPKKTTPRFIDSWNLSPEARALRDAVPAPNPIPSAYEGSVSFVQHQEAIEALTLQLQTMTMPLTVPDTVPDTPMNTTSTSSEENIPNKRTKKN